MGGTVSWWTSLSLELVGSPEDDFENHTDENEKGSNEDDDDQGHNYDANFGQWGGRFHGGLHFRWNWWVHLRMILKTILMKMKKGPMRTMMIKGIIMMLTLVSGGDGFRVDFTFVRTGGFT